MIGLAFTTHNRQEVLDETLAAVAEHTPKDTPVVVVDDGSKESVKVPDWAKLVRHDQPRGIPAAKNRCIAELMDLGVDHLFLFDDDTRPAAPYWWVPYVESSEPHFAYCWTKFAKDRRKVPKMDVVYRDSQLVAYGWSMGCLLYVHRSAVERVGGMWPGFGMGMEEHAEWSQRIHNAGLTSFVHQDHPDMQGKVWAADEHYAVERSFHPNDRNRLLVRNEQLRRQRQDNDEYVEYRETRDVVLTSFFTSQKDPQRPRKLIADKGLLEPLRASVRGAEMVTLHDCFDTLACEHVRIDAPKCAYQQRWLSQWQWLRDHPEVRWVFVVDATDVRMLREPWAKLQPGVLYCGWEPTVVGCDWIRRHSPGRREWVEEHASEMLLNCGVVGGDRATVMRLCKRMVDLWASDPNGDPLHEMTHFNMAAREIGFVTGPQVTTVFKSGATSDPHAWWAHK